MQAIDTELLERSVRFQRGQPLPAAQDLIGSLNQLGAARDACKANDAFRVEHGIRSMVPESRIYKGYLGDDLTVSIVRTGAIRRKGPGANTQTFWIKLDVLEGTSVVRTLEIELVEFLSEIRREGGPGKFYAGPRFLPE